MGERFTRLYLDAATVPAAPLPALVVATHSLPFAILWTIFGPFGSLPLLILPILLYPRSVQYTSSPFGDGFMTERIPRRRNVASPANVKLI